MATEQNCHESNKGENTSPGELKHVDESMGGTGDNDLSEHQKIDLNKDRNHGGDKTKRLTNTVDIRDKSHVNVIIENFYVLEDLQKGEPAHVHVLEIETHKRAQERKPFTFTNMVE